MFSVFCKAISRYSAIFSISSVVQPRVVSAGVPIRIPEGERALLASFGIMFLFTEIPIVSRMSCARSPEIP